MPQTHHSDVIGSLLRPKYLQQARDAYAAGQLPAPDFKRIEDRAVDQAIAMQEGIGLDVITDGELRRFSFFDQVTFELDGMGPGEGAGVHFRNATDEWIWHSPVVVTSKLSQKRKITIEEFAKSRFLPRIEITPKAKQTYKSHLKNHVYPYLGRERIAEISREQLYTHLATTLPEAGATLVTRRAVRTVLSSMLQMAWDEQYRHGNPVMTIKLKKVPAKPPSTVASVAISVASKRSRPRRKPTTSATKARGPAWAASRSQKYVSS